MGRARGEGSERARGVGPLVCQAALPLARIGLEAGPLSQWLYAGLREAGLAVELLETRHVRDAFKAMPVKTDRKDARGIAQLMRLGWFRPVHCKSLPAQETRALLTARKLLQAKLHDFEMSLRGILRGFGLKAGATTARTFEARIRELVAGHPTLGSIADALLAARRVLARELQGLETRVRRLARDDKRARLLMSAPGVGSIVALTYVAAIDDPGRRLRRALGELYDWYDRVEADLAIFLRDASVVPANAEVLAEMTAGFGPLTGALARDRPRRRSVRAAIGHALEFETWRSLVRRQGLSRTQAVDAMTRLVSSV